MRLVLVCELQQRTRRPLSPPLTDPGLTRTPLDTLKLANGVYVVTVTAVDAAGNRGTVSERLEVWNPENAH